MNLPNLDVGAQRMLESAGYLWSNMHHGYRRKRRRHEPSNVYHHRGPVVIELEELEDHGLAAPHLTPHHLTPHQRDLALEWLSERIRQAD
jgi:hypothetical protein